MTSTIQPRASLPLMNSQRPIIMNIYNPMLNNRNINSINGSLLNNNLNNQKQNINPNLTKVSNVNNSYNNNIRNTYSSERIRNSKTLPNSSNLPKKNLNFGRLYSSGTLIPSKRSKRYNIVRKGNNEIKNIDINNESEGIENNLDIISTNSLKKKVALTNGNNLSPEMIPQNTNHMFRTVDTGLPNSSFKLNPFARFVNYIIDKINPNVNKPHSQIFDPYNNKFIHNRNDTPLNSTYNELDNKSSQFTNNTNPTNNDINKNQINPIKNEINLKDKSTEELSKINTSTNSNIKLVNNNLNNQKVQPITTAQTPNLIQKTPTLSSNKSPLPVSSNNKFDTFSKTNEKSNLTDKKSQSTTKREEDKRSESKTSSSKFPFQPLNTIGNTKNNLSKMNRVPLDTYLPTHLNEYLQTENQYSLENILNNKKGKGFKCCSQLTQAGKEADGQIKIDQDTPLIYQSIGGVIGFNMFGVLDGHGPHGHFVSQFCKDYFIKSVTRFAELLKIQKGISNAEDIYNELKINKFVLLSELFNQADIEIANQRTFDSTISGTTCNLVFQFNKHLVCCSVGDSRCIIVYDKGDKLNQGILPLSTDHKPDLPGELERIRLYGGEVDYLKDMYGNRIGPPRVFKIGSEYPGLAMSRSLGDLLAKQVGVIPSPQIIEYDINFSTKYLLICSDGVWEFSSNEKVRDIGNNFYIRNDVAGFCTNLVKYAMSLWEQIEVIRDDITVVTVFF